MTRRMIDAALWQNEKFTRMPMGARMLQLGIITHADDQGRAKASLSFLRMQIFPDDEEVTNVDIQRWLDLMVKNGTIILYVADEKQYVQLINWWKYQSLQYAQPSQYPRPSGWQDRIRKTVTKGFIATCNWVTVDGTQLEDTCDQNGQPLPKRPSKTKPAPSSSGQSPNGTGPNQVKPTQPITANSGESSPLYSPESSPERTIELNINKLNKTTLPRACEAESAPETESGGSGGGSKIEQDSTEYVQICAKFEKNGFGTLTEILAEEINTLLGEYPHTWILDAITVAVQANNRRLRYVRGILAKWRADGRQGSGPPIPLGKPKQQTALLPIGRWCLDKYFTSNPKFVPDKTEELIHAEYEQYKQQYYRQQTH